MAGIDLVVTDLDGTLWFGHEEVHRTVVPAWRELERRSIAVMVATGRRAASTRVPLARLGLSPPAVILNGALVIDLASGRRHHRQLYDLAAAQQVLRACRAADVEPCVYVDHPTVDVFVGERPSTHPIHLRELGSSAATSDLEEVVGTIPTLMFGVVGHQRDPLTEVARALTGIAEIHVSEPDHYGGFSLNVTPLGLSKWVGVLAYCREAGIDADRILAIGDGPNDVELLAAAQVAVAPCDASTGALAVADHIVAPAREGGWASILDFV